MQELKNSQENNKKYDYFLPVFILTVIVCFGYFITNPVMGIDDEMIYVFTENHNIINVNRIGKFILKALFNYEFAPFVYDFLCIFCYSVSALLASKIFIKCLPSFSKKESWIFSLLAVSFPFAGYSFIFMEHSIDVGFSMLSSVFAAFLFNKYLFEEKKKIYITGIILSLMFSVSLYESGLFYFILISFFVILYSLIFENSIRADCKTALKRAAGTGVIVVSSVVLCHLLLLILQLITNNVHNRGKEDYLKYDFSSIHAFFNSFSHSMKEFFNIFLENLHTDFSCKIILFSVITLLFISIFYSVKRRNMAIIIISFFMVLTPIQYFLLTGFYNMPYRVCVPYDYLCAMVFVILFKLISRNTMLSRVFLFAVFLIVFHQAKEMNNIFYTENLKFQNDKLFAYSIDYDLKKLNFEKRPIVFAGVRENIKTPHTYYSRADEINISTFNWDRYDSEYDEILVKRPFRFMRALGYEIEGFYENPENFNQNFDYYTDILNENVPDMQIYPKENSIKDLGDFVVIKIGESRFKKKKTD